MKYTSESYDSLISNKNLTMHKDTPIIVGCNYHTTWQSNKAMRFVLSEIKGDKARLRTRRTGSDFWTDIENLVFIRTQHNIKKGISKL